MPTLTLILYLLAAGAVGLGLFWLSVAGLVLLLPKPHQQAETWRAVARLFDEQREKLRQEVVALRADREALRRVSVEYEAVAALADSRGEQIKSMRAALDRAAGVDWFRMVGEFHAKFGVKGGNLSNPRQPDWDTLLLGMALIREEHDELRDAVDRGDLAGVADGIADSIYVLIGLAHRYGIDLVPIFAAVHAANMAKTPATPELVAQLEAKGVKVPIGKILKPDGWQPPDIAGLLRRQ
jgi:NTP pyrophosphatase (non-canonical NTP hydrolase)/uncharacterized membrane protein